jgi:hypothetical protein
MLDTEEYELPAVQELCPLPKVTRSHKVNILSEYIIKIKNMKPKRVNKHAKCKFHVKKK